jgi:hypothetical protein
MVSGSTVRLKLLIREFGGRTISLPAGSRMSRIGCHDLLWLDSDSFIELHSQESSGV